MVLKPLLTYKMQSMGRKQSEEITLPDLYKAYRLPPFTNLESLKLVSTPEQYPFECSLNFLPPSYTAIAIL